MAARDLALDPVRSPNPDKALEEMDKRGIFAAID